MAKEISFPDTTGLTEYVNLTNSVGEWYNTAGAVFEAFDALNWTDYDIAASEDGASGIYFSAMPSVAAGSYGVIARRRAGGSPAQSDTIIGEGSVEWDGSAVLTPGAVTTNNDKAGYSLSLVGTNLIVSPITTALADGTVQLNAAYDAAKTAATQASVDAVAADLPGRITKNVALAGFSFPMFDSADHVTLKTGLAVTATRSLDGGAFGACANSAAEIGTTGVYKIDLAATDLNANVVVLKFTGASADTNVITIVTQVT